MTSQASATEWETLLRLHRAPEVLRALSGIEGPELALQRRLRREFPSDLVRAAMSLAELRSRAAKRFSRAEQMWFDRQGLEQATAEQVARHKAQRFDGLVWDLCCGIGGDAIALASRSQVIAVDANPCACLRMKWNCAAYGVNSAVQAVCADVLKTPFPKCLVHVDPDRRPGRSGRTQRVEDCMPSLSYLRQLTARCPGGAIKLGPACNFADKFPGQEIELVSLAGECKEATVWFGELAGDAPLRATVLPAGESLAGDPAESTANVGALGKFLHDPNPAVVRAGLLDVLAERLDLRRLDDAEEYLTSDRVVHSPFLQTFEVLAELPNNDREIRGWFRRSDVGQVEIKCRRIAIDVEAVRRKLPLTGDRPGVLVFARLNGKARAIVCRRIANPYPEST